MTNNKQQTAVEWLIEQFWNNEGMLTSKKLEKAKEMEKEQIVKAVNKGWNYHEDGFVSWMGEQYYNETYGGGEQ
jgi:hypothetical protein